MRLSSLIGVLLCFSCITPALACTAPAPATNQMAILTPCSPTLVTANQKTAPALTYIAIAAADAMQYPNAAQPFQVHAIGMVNVEVWVHGAMAARLVNNGSDIFTGAINTYNENAGPLPISIFAWNSAPGDNSYTVSLAAKDLVIRPGQFYVPAQHWPAAAAGMHLVWQDDFNSQFTLHSVSCKTGTGIWPNCQAPTSADGWWYENKAGGGDFGDAAFEHSDSVNGYGPFTVYQGGLQIRATYDPNYVDPYGFHRHWRSGILSGAFPDGSTNAQMTTAGDGYYEIRVITPDAQPNGGTWPAFWTLDRRAITNHAIGNTEWDVMEEYGLDKNYWHANEWDYSPATGPNGAIFQGYPAPGKDLSVDWHRYGLLVKGGNVTAYFDGVPFGTRAEGTLGDGIHPNPFFLIDLAMGSGFPVNPPPAGYFDMWVSDVEYYAP